MTSAGITTSGKAFAQFSKDYNRELIESKGRNAYYMEQLGFTHRFDLSALDIKTMSKAIERDKLTLNDCYQRLLRRKGM